MTRHLIVGSGIAALSAIEAARARDAAAEILVVAEEERPFYSRPGLAYHLAGMIPAEQLTLRTAAELAELRFTVVHGRAAAIDPAGHQVTLAGGRQLSYDRLLLATGARAVPLGLPGAELDGVHALDSLAQARRLVAGARRGRVAVVIGGGITALELAEGLRARGARTLYLLRADRVWVSVLDADEATLVERHLAADGVEVRREVGVARITGRDGAVAGVETTTGERIACDLVAAAIGVRPRAELAAAAGLRVDRGVLVDDRMHTSAADVFAAGDVAQTVDPATGEAVVDTLWSTAKRHGEVAGAVMAGADDRYRRRTAVNITLLAGVPTTIIGAVGGGRDLDTVAIVRGDSETWHRPRHRFAAIEAHAGDRMRVLADDRCLVGAVVMGEQSPAAPLQHLIEDQVPLAGLRATGELAIVAPVLAELERLRREGDAPRPA